MNNAAAAPVVNLRLVVAENDASQRELISALLTQAGATHLVEVDSGQHALQACGDKTAPVNICFIDLHLPDMDGIELLRRLARCENPPSVVLTSGLDAALLPSIEALSNAYHLDVLGTFEKPATLEMLQSFIGRYQSPSTRKGTAGHHAHPVFTLAEIQQGLQADEFEPFFQPKVELATREVKAVEAFARWRHSQYGILPAPAFIPLLETSGCMQSLTWTVIERSVAACRDWHDKGLMLSVSINLSAASLAEAGLVEKILNHIAQHGIAPQFLTFEISELIAMTEVPICLENLARMRMKGFGLSVDDYGTGHSNLQQLLRIPFLDLKIDRSFVAGATKNKAMASSLRASIDLARKLQRDSVAVGVESREDWDLLHNLGCTYAQGYYIAKPMESALIPAWITQWSQLA